VAPDGIKASAGSTRLASTTYGRFSLLPLPPQSASTAAWHIVPSIGALDDVRRARTHPYAPVPTHPRSVDLPHGYHHTPWPPPGAMNRSQTLSIPARRRAAVECVRSWQPQTFNIVVSSPSSEPSTYLEPRSCDSRKRFWIQHSETLRMLQVAGSGSGVGCSAAWLHADMTSCRTSCGCRGVAVVIGA
jgi:hypothetical protein